MRKPLIRFAQPGDEPQIINIMRETTIGNHHIVEGGISDAMLETLLVAILDDRIVGYALAIKGERSCFIDSVAVLPEYQHEGVGAWLVIMLADMLFELGVKRLITSAYPDNFVSRGLLQAGGFQTIGTQEIMFKHLIRKEGTNGWHY